MDTTTLMVGQDVFIRSGRVGNWAKVVKVTPTGVIVESDPVYGAELIRFDENGVAVDSSDICNHYGVWGESKIPGTSEGPWKLYFNTKDAGFAKTIASKAQNNPPCG
jgi:hypothetical protein